MKVRITDHQAKLIRNAQVHDEYTVWSIKGTRIESFQALHRAGLITAPTYGAKLTVQGLSAKWSLENDPMKRVFPALEVPAAETAPAQWWEDAEKYQRATVQELEQGDRIAFPVAIGDDGEPGGFNITSWTEVDHVEQKSDGVWFIWRTDALPGHDRFVMMCGKSLEAGVLRLRRTAEPVGYTGIVRSVRDGGAVVELADGDCLSVEIPRGRSATVGEVYTVTTETFQRLAPGVPDWRVMGEVTAPTEDEKAAVRREVAASRVEAANAGHLVWRRNGGGSWRSLDGRWVITPGPVVAWKGRPDTWSVVDDSGLKEPFDRQSLADAQRACRSFSVSRPAPVPAR